MTLSRKTRLVPLSETTRAQALQALDGMRQIINRDMLVKGEYVTQEVHDPSLEDQLCAGRRYCIIGSLWVGAGVRPQDKGYETRLPGVEDYEREDFLRSRHGLRFAYDALNEAATAYIEEHSAPTDPEYEAPIEGLFECAQAAIGRPELLKFIATAERKLRAA